MRESEQKLGSNAGVMSRCLHRVSGKMIETSNGLNLAEISNFRVAETSIWVPAANRFLLKLGTGAYITISHNGMGPSQWTKSSLCNRFWGRFLLLFADENSEK